MNRFALTAVAFFLVGSAVAWTLASRSAPEPAVSAAAPEPAVPPDGRLDDVLTALARLETRLDSHLAAEPAPPVPGPGDEAALAEILAALEDLRTRLARAESVALRSATNGSSEQAPASPGYDLITLKQAKPEPEWKALKKLIHRWNLDEQAVRQETQLLGYREVLERYGTPTEVWGTRENLNWLYVDGIDPFTGETQVEVWFQFVDGFVVQTGVKQP